MAKGFALTLCCLVALTACSKKAANSLPNGQIPNSPDTFAISSSKLENCHFKNPNPTYSFNSTIEPNTILCDEGVPRKVEVLTPNALPSGLQFTMNQLALTGTAKERVVAAPYEFYIENEAGYAIIKLLVTVK